MVVATRSVSGKASRYRRSFRTQWPSNHAVSTITGTIISRAHSTAITVMSDPDSASTSRSTPPANNAMTPLATSPVTSAAPAHAASGTIVLRRAGRTAAALVASTSDVSTPPTRDSGTAWIQRTYSVSEAASQAMPTRPASASAT